MKIGWVSSALAVAAAFALASACGGRAGGTSGGGSDGGAECSGTTPECADACGSDYFPARAECMSGEWVCPEGTVLASECPSGTCWGAPLPGETCSGGWSCEPDAAAYQACPALMCATCRGFDDPQQVGDCVCECTDSDEVRCFDLDEPPPPSSACEGLDFCACYQRSDCTYETDGCVCPCDYECPGEPPCDCDCGGGTFLGCRSVGE